MGRKKLNVVVDMAGPTANTHGRKLELLREVTGLNIPGSRFLLSRTIHQTFPLIDGSGERELTRDDYRKMTRKLFESEDRVLNIPPIDGAIDAIGEMSQKHNVIFVTNQKDPSVGFYRSWLKKHGLGGIRLESSAHAPHRSKAEYTTSADVVIDDKIGNLAPLVGTVPAPILFRGWGEHTPEEIESFRKNEDVYVVDTWKEVLRTVQMIEKGASRNPFPSMTHGAFASRV